MPIGLLLIFSLIILWLAWAKGPRDAIWATIGLTFLIPTWLLLYWGGIKLELRAGIIIVLLGCLVLHSGYRLNYRWVLLDGLVGCFAVSQLVSIWLNGFMQAGRVVDAVSAWLIPYAAGRLVSRSDGGTLHLARVAALVCIPLAITAVVESTAAVNLYEAVLGDIGSVAKGKINEEDLSRKVKNEKIFHRWGMKRAYGQTLQPIFFGMTLLLLFPWTVLAAWLAKQQRSPAWWRFSPYITFGAALCSASRGPLIGFLATLYFMAFFSMPKWRVNLATLAVVGVLAVFSTYELALDYVDAWADDPPRKSTSNFEIAGQSVKYSGTIHRVLLFVVYQDAMTHAGWFGFGPSYATDETPEMMKYVDREHWEMFRSIDNYYINLVLSYGYVGCTLFLAMGLCALTYLFRARSGYTSSDPLVAALLFGVVPTVLILLMAETYSLSFGFFWLFTLGIVGRWRADDLELMTSSAPMHVPAPGGALTVAAS